jgi:RNA polymerase sigma factor (TIGR02999 family)
MCTIPDAQRAGRPAQNKVEGRPFSDTIALLVSQEGDMTALLRAWAEGDDAARDAAVELAYAELRRIAQNRIRGEGDAATIDATGLAHEAFVRLAQQTRVQWQNRAQFFAIAARTMRRILVDRHRARKAMKRDATCVVLSSEPGAATPEELDLELLNRALDRLALQDPRQAQIVELRFFAGLSIEDAAEVVGISPATVKREWALARAWLRREIAGDA